MKRLSLILIMFLLTASTALAGNIFIEEGDLFHPVGIAVADDANLKPNCSDEVMAKVVDIKEFNTLEFKVDVNIGQKLKLLNKHDDVWEVLDLATGKHLGTLKNPMVK